MAGQRDPNLSSTRSRNWVLAAGAIAVALGVIYYLLSMSAQEGVAVDGSPEPVAVEETTEAPAAD